MRLLIGGSPSKLFHLNEFANNLNNLGMECKVVIDSQIYDGFPSRNIRNWLQSKDRFNDLLKQFRPDAIFIDRHRHFGVAATKTGLPLFVHIRGDHWSEIEMAKETLYKTPPKRFVLKQWEKMAEQCFQKSTLMLPICDYLNNIVKQRYPEKDAVTLYQGINPSNWYHVESVNLKHPCVGLLQGAVIFEKAKEMLVLEQVLKSLPHVTFYWVGDGPYRDYVLERLKNMIISSGLGILITLKK